MVGSVDLQTSTGTRARVDLEPDPLPVVPAVLTPHAPFAKLEMLTAERP